MLLFLKITSLIYHIQIYTYKSYPVTYISIQRSYINYIFVRSKTIKHVIRPLSKLSQVQYNYYASLHTIVSLCSNPNNLCITCKQK